MDKKTIIGICTSIVVVIIVFFAWLGFSITSKTNEAKKATSEFVKLLQAGELERLSIGYYAYSETDKTVYTDDNGIAKAQIVSKQQMADIFGVDALMLNNASSDASEETSAENVEKNVTDEELLKLIMKHTQMQYNLGKVWSRNTKMELEMLIPDMKNWFVNLKEEDFKLLNSIESGSGLLEELESRIASGEIVKQYIQITIPMVEQNGKWRFAVTEDIEHTFFGGLYDIFLQEETE